jgi:DNA (cytosine-5)-methyltransferase 1
MTYGSLFSGIGGMDLGFDRAGLRCLWQCEIDKQARSVLALHWPSVKRFIDVRDIRKKDLEPVDIITGGFPCQDHSIAGTRKGMDGDKGKLFYEFVRVISLRKPRFVVWENVGGLLSGDDGRSLARVLRELAELGYFGAWRVLDARFFGVPQRRRRVFGVFARGRFGAMRCAEILSLGQSVQGHLAASGTAEEEIAGTIGGGSGNRGWCDDTDRITFIPDLSCTLLASDGGFSSGMHQVVANCLTAGNGSRVDADRDTLVFPESFRVAGDGAAYAMVGESGTLTTNTDRSSNVVVFQQNQRDEVRYLQEAGAISANPGMKQQNYLHMNAGVRRLTPRECERLMSYPDDWTRYGADGKEMADGPRYRMCGNGVVSNVAEWLAKRIIKHAEVTQ